MRIDLHSREGDRVMRMDVDPERPPIVVHVESAGGPRTEHYLDWDRAFTDEGHLRKCPACGCEDLYRRRTVPPLTGFIAVMIVGLICLALWGLTDSPWELLVAALIVVIIANVLIVRFAPRYLVCYRCRSAYHRIGISRTQRDWNVTIAERYRDRT